jgi:ABC-type transport system substrate-binding protein
MGDILGVKEKLAGKAESVAGLKAIDERRLEVTLDSPKPYFPAKLSYPTSFIVDQATTKTSPRDWVWKANPSGPYKLKEYTEGESLILVRNPNYHNPAAISTITFVLNPGGSPISRYEDGTLDILYVGGSTAERVRREDDPLHDQWQSAPSLCTMTVQMNNSIPPFDDPQVRKAFALAVDRDGFVERLTNNIELPALTILPPSMPGFSPDLSAVSYDPAAAKTALQASRYAGNLPPVSLEASGLGTEGRADVNALVENWRQALDVEVEVIYLDSNNYTREARNEDGQMSYYGWCADYPDPQNFLDVLYHTDSEFNVSGYTNAQVDSLLGKANIEADPARRVQLYQQIEKLLIDDFAFIPISHSVYDVLVNPRVEGFVLAPMNADYISWLSLKP